MSTASTGQSVYVDRIRFYRHIEVGAFFSKTLQVVSSQLVMKKRLGGFYATRCYSITYVIYVILI